MNQCIDQYKSTIRVQNQVKEFKGECFEDKDADSSGKIRISEMVVVTYPRFFKA